MKELKPVLKDGKLENFMPRVNGKAFVCSCKCNVFHKPDDKKLSLYQCNACGQQYSSE